MADRRDPSPHPHATRQRRPRAVSFVASLLLFEAVLVVLVGALIAVGLVAGQAVPTIATDGAFGPFLSVLPGLGLAITILVAGLGLALASLGLLRLQGWGWLLAMAIQGVGLANALYTHLTGTPQHVQLALGSIVVLVLNQREVRQAFASDDHDA